MDRSSIFEDISYLTGSVASGRLSGTAGAYQTANYLSAKLAASGYKSTFQVVKVPATRLIERPQLLVENRAYLHRIDFSEITAQSAGGKASGKLMIVSANDHPAPERFIGRVVLIPERPHNFDLVNTVKAAEQLGVAALLVEFGEPQYFHKTVYNGGGKIPVLRVRKSIAEQLTNMADAPVEIILPLENKTLACKNVLGFSRGPPNTSFTLALTAHYDHVGDDPGGARFPGAFDNASGVASIIATASELAKQPLPFHTLIAFLTGEESGLWGAKQLVAPSPAPISAVINLDGIGSEPRLNALRLGGWQSDNWLAKLAKRILSERGIQAQWISGSDDSSIFFSKGIPTLGLGQQPTHPTPVALHTPLDSLESLYLETVQEGSEVILEIVHSISQSFSQSQLKENSHVYK